MSRSTRAAASPFEPAGLAWRSVSPRLRTARYLILSAFLGTPTLALTALAIAVGGWAWLAPALFGLVTLWVALLVPRQVRAIGYAEREQDLLVRKGVLFRTLVVVPYGRMQFVDVQSGPLARALGIAQVQLHTASPGTDASIPGLPPEEAARLRDRLAALGEARLAGL
jgi:membrane protein YdbS with pleckstrin-like domain